MTKLLENPADARRARKSWCAELFLVAFEEVSLSSVREESLQLLRRRRVMDVTISAGSISAKIHHADSKPVRVELKLSVLSSSEWESIYRALAKQALFLAKMLAGEMPQEIEDVFRSADAVLLPDAAAAYELITEQHRSEQLSPELGALVLHLYDRFDRDPFSVFAFRGSGREETLYEVKLERRRSLPGSESTPTMNYGEMGYEPAPPLGETLAHFWNLGSAARDLRYSIKADELPAAILKRLDPIPLSTTLQDEVESTLEEAYVQVARRAQAYGLGL